VTATVEASWLNPDKERSLTVVCSDAVLRLDYLQRQLSLVTGGGEPLLIDGFAPSVRGRRRAFAVRRDEPLAVQLDAFLAALRAGRPSPVGVADGARAVSLVQQLVKSAGSGEPVLLDAQRS
jgi:predicted dehydrogenase